MKPIDLRNATWAEVLTHVTEDLTKVHLAWMSHGPGTTRQVAQRSGISLLTLRPRTTDLGKLGLVILEGHEGNEGIYAYRSRKDAEISRAWVRDADFRKPGSQPSALNSQPEKIGFITVEDAINSLEPAARGALGAKLMSQYGHHLKRRNSAGTEQLSLLPA